jgi:hypothetical protein
MRRLHDEEEQRSGDVEGACGSSGERIGNQRGGGVRIREGGERMPGGKGVARFSMTRGCGLPND